MASHRKAQIRFLRWAQRSICAGCGKPVPSARKLEPTDLRYPTFDHVRLRSKGGAGTLANGMLKHRACNQARGARPASGCDLVWQSLVRDKLGTRPRSLKPVFKGGVPNRALCRPTS